MLITQAEFARRMKVSPQAITKAVKSGRLNLIAGRLDEKVATLQWDLNRQRPAPPPPMPRPDATEPATAPDWLIENAGLWVAMNWNPEALPAAARRWLELAAGGPVNPELQARFVALLREFADCVARKDLVEKNQVCESHTSTGKDGKEYPRPG